MAILIRNISQADEIDSLIVPMRPDGKRYRFEMICENGWARVYSDSESELLAHLIAGYESLNDEEKLRERISHACDMQVSTQAQLNLFFSTSDINQEEHDVLYGPRHMQPFISSWGCTVPLVLVDSFYAPYSDLPRPYSSISDVAMPSNIWWLKPSQSEMEYILSLHELSIIDLSIAKDEVL